MESPVIDNPILKFNLDFKYESSSQRCLRNFSGSIDKGECIALVGASGCGKSTVLRCLNGLIPEFYEGDLNACVLLNNLNIGNLSIGQIGRNISFVFQDPRTQFFTLNSDTEIAFGLENFGIDSEIIRKKVDQCFTRFDLNHLRNRKVFELSSGERQIIAILSAWALDTKIILLDEPTANLDIFWINKLTEILLELKKAGKTLVICEHRLYYLQELADRYWYLEKGKLSKNFTRSEFAELSNSELKQLGLRVTELEQIKRETRPDSERTLARNCLEIDNLSFSYAEHKVLKSLNFEVATGEALCLIGANGSGKTTLGKCICGLLNLESGGISYKGEKLSKKDLANQSIFIMQEAEFQFFTNSIMHEIVYGKKENPDENLVKLLLEDAGLWELRNRHPFSLSGGQMQKLTLILAYLSEKKIVVLDEPTSGLDRNSLTFCVALIEKMKREKIVIAISHDLEFIASAMDRCIRIEAGMLVQDTRAFGINEVYKSMLLPKYNLPANKLLSSKLTSQDIALDPRVNLAYLLITIIIVGVGNPSYVFINAILLLVLALANERYKVFAINSLILFSIYGLTFIHPTATMIFISNYIPRFLLIGMIFPIILGGEGASQMLAALRRIKLPEKLIMGCAVIFRFFPVLSNDLKIMSQAIKTRLDRQGKNPLESSLEFFEAVIVSMVFRVIRIAETLSSSAETRGISLAVKRGSYICLEMRLKDYLLLLSLFVSIFISVYRR